jgi:hypothetical protein
MVSVFPALKGSMALVSDRGELSQNVRFISAKHAEHLRKNEED